MIERAGRALQLECLVDRFLLPAGVATERYVRLTVQFSRGVAPRPRLPVNLSLILDRSGSMNGKKLDCVKRAVAHTLGHLSSQDTASIVMYDQHAEVVAEAFSVSPSAIDEAVAKVGQASARGRTNVSLGWYTGCDQIADHIGTGVINRALLMTDGRANEGVVDIDVLAQQAGELRVRGISTSTFGVGEGFNHFLLQRIADAGGGHFYFLDAPEAMTAAFHSELAELLSTVAKDVVVEVGVPAGAEVEPLNGVLCESSPARRIRMLLGDGFARDTRELVLRIKLPVYQRNQHLLIPVSIEYEDTLDARLENIDQPGIIFETADDDRCRAQRVNEDVLHAACRSEVDRAKMDALYREYEGDLDGADVSLKAAETTVVALLPTLEARPLVEEIGHLADELHLGLNERVRKTRHYRLYRDQRRRPDAGNVPTIP